MKKGKRRWVHYAKDIQSGYPSVCGKIYVTSKYMDFTRDKERVTCRRCKEVLMAELDPTIKANIDSMDYEDMFRLRRFAPCGHKFFVSDTPANDYFNERMDMLKKDISDREHVVISKRIGWDE